MVGAELPTCRIARQLAHPLQLGNLVLKAARYPHQSEAWTAGLSTRMRGGFPSVPSSIVLHDRVVDQKLIGLEIHLCEPARIIDRWNAEEIWFIPPVPSPALLPLLATHWAPEEYVLMRPVRYGLLQLSTQRLRRLDAS
jgi:hypothetical protein